MALIYRTTGPWGPGKDANLVAAEVDANFWELAQRAEALEQGLPVPTGIADIAVVAGRLRIYLSDGSQRGPWALPQAAFQWRGAWEAGTAYQPMDVVAVDAGSADAGVYLVLEAHVSATGFAADEEGTAGPLYHLVFGILPGGTSLVRIIADDAHVLSGADMAHFLRCTNAAGCEVTVPADAAGPVAVSSEVAIRQSAFAPVTVSPASGVSLLPVAGRVFATGFRGAVVRLKKVAANTWAVWGDLAPEPPTEPTEVLTEPDTATETPTEPPTS